MVDRLSPERRSWLMSRVKGRDTTPELVVRKIAHRLGFRFRLAPKHLPGRPDLTFARHRAVIFVHGCFWHRHENCRKATVPKSREVFWQEKFARNVARDHATAAELKRLGWRVLVIWECETKAPQAVAERIAEFLAGSD